MARVLPASGLERPWRRPGAVGYALARVRGIARPPVTVYEPAPGSVVSDLDVAVPMRDGTLLRVNAYRPPGDGPFPVILSAHPYGKDRLPSRRGGRSRFSAQYRIMRQPAPVSFSTLTSWEAPDPAWWTAQGYAVVNADLRGSGTSDGVGSLMSAAEARDIADLVEWAGHQRWSTGNVGMLGVSYLAMSQYRAAALAPPALKAICPWEGMTDPYRDLMRPGGLYERGFSRIWAAGTRRLSRLDTDLAKEQRDRPLRDEWWQAHTPELEQIEVPMLVCASFSDNNLHSRGSFRAFEQAGSPHRFAYTHRGGKWSVFYGEPARRAQLAFFDRYLRGLDVPEPARVRLEVRESGDRVAEVRDEQEWPLARTEWTPLYLSSGARLGVDPVDRDGHVTFRTGREAAAFTFKTPSETELTGPMALRLWLSVDGADDVDLVVGVEKWRGRRYVGFEGSYGFGRDRVATGWQQASLRRLDESASTTGEPVHTFLTRRPLVPGEVVAVDVALGPSATLFRAGESLRLVVAGRWLWPANPLTGQFPARYRRSPSGRCTLHWGPDRPAHLLVPRIPRRPGWGSTARRAQAGPVPADPVPAVPMKEE
ncbi:CocE/NonD family hydrolase [Intrasporangium sp.]|uniref:CocE/NonD family hydrolase n=1 Tax=Intrasporangium sp. TaxID=1925024 RepID=UPI003221465D